MNQNGNGSFRQQLAFGKVAEGAIARWLMGRGHSILPVYEKEVGDGTYKGPQLYRMRESFAAPDLLVFSNASEILWVEAKRKSVFTWWRKGRVWETGIDLRHYRDYLAIRDRIGIRMLLMFLHECSEPSPIDRPFLPPGSTCPTGLFAGEIGELSANESHRDPRHGRSGMVYWAHETLVQLATLEQIECVATSRV
jgi:hypothetical protein